MTELRPRPRGDAASPHSARRTLVATMVLVDVVLTFAFALNASPSFAIALLLVSYGIVIIAITATYSFRGRLVATPAFMLFALVALYTIPISCYTMIGDPQEFAVVCRSALMLATGLVAIAAVLIALDRPAPSPALASLVEKRQIALSLAGYALLVCGMIWVVAVFGSLRAFFVYVNDTTYYEKHVYFEGHAARGMFTMCFELAGLVAMVPLAVPKARRRVPLLVNIVPVLVMVAFVTNQGYRSPLVLAIATYVCCRSFWRDRAVRNVTLLAWALALVPVFLIWAYVRYEISSASITDIEMIRGRAEQADWTNLRGSEISMMLYNGSHLLDLLDGASWKYQLGESFFVGPLEAMIPRALWRDRPDALQIVFTRAVAPSYAEGGTISFSFLLEGYLNFWLPGVIVVSSALTSALIASQRFMERLAHRRSYLAVMALVLSNTLVWFYIRDDFGDLVRRLSITLLIGLTGIGLGRFVEMNSFLLLRRSVPQRSQTRGRA